MRIPSLNQLSKIELKILKRLFSTLIILSHVNAIASVPLVQAETTRPDQFSGFAAANHAQTLSDYLDEVPEKENDHLGHLLERAQEVWLTGSMTSARSIFVQMTDLSLQQDWRQAERETLAYAFMRLAQLATAGADRDAILKQLITFDPHVTIDGSLFPPPLLERYEALRLEMVKVREPIHLKSIFAASRYLRINGVKFDVEMDNNLTLAPGQYRVSIFSDSSPSLSRIMTREEIQSYDDTTQSSITGTCEHPSLGRLPLADGASFDVLFPQGCLRSFSQGRWLDGKSNSLTPSESTVPDGAHENALNQADLPRAQIPSEWLPHSPGGDAMMPMASIETSPWESKKTWLWIGVSAVVLGAAYAIYQNQRGSPSVQATHGTIQ